MNRIIYAQFLGLFLLKAPIPKELIQYVREHDFDTDDRDLWNVVALIRNAPDLSDDDLRKFVIMAIMSL